MVRRRRKSAGSRARVRARARTRRKGKAKARAKERAKKKRRARSSRDGVTTAENGVTKLQTVDTKETSTHQVQGKAGSASSSNSQSTLSATDVGTKEIGLIESVCEDAEMSWLFMIADAVAINQLSMDGAHSLVVDSGAYVHVCPKSSATQATLEQLPACWRGLDLRSASGKMLKVWGMRGVVYNVVDLHGKVFTVRIPFVVCEVRRPLLSLAMLEDKGFH